LLSAPIGQLLNEGYGWRIGLTSFVILSVAMLPAADALGSYTMAWRIGVALGLAGGIIQVAFALIRPSEPRRPSPA
jgi:hypothetical protein